MGFSPSSLRVAKRASAPRGEAAWGGGGRGGGGARGGSVPGVGGCQGWDAKRRLQPTWPSTKAISWRKSAEEQARPAARAAMLAAHPRFLRANMARYLAGVRCQVVPRLSDHDRVWISSRKQY